VEQTKHCKLYFGVIKRLYNEGFDVFHSEHKASETAKYKNSPPDSSTQYKFVRTDGPSSSKMLTQIISNCSKLTMICLKFLHNRPRYMIVRKLQRLNVWVKVRSEFVERL